MAVLVGKGCFFSWKGATWKTMLVFCEKVFANLKSNLMSHENFIPQKNGGKRGTVLIRMLKKATIK